MNHRTLLRDCALALPVLIAVGVYFGGLMGGLGVLVAGLVTMVNLRLWMGLTAWFTRAVTTENQALSALVAMGFLVKVPLTIGMYYALVWAFTPQDVALGLCALVIGVTVRGVYLLFSIPVDDSAESIQESMS